MGWFSDAADAVGDGINKFVDEVADTIEDAADEVKDAYESIADYFEDNIPWIGGGLATFTRWLGRVTESIFDFAGAVVRGVGSILAGVISGVLHIFSGDFMEGILDIFHGILGAVLIVVGSAVSVGQTIFGYESHKRRLNKDERLLLEPVFCVSVDLDRIRIVQGASGIFDFSHRPFTMGNMIYMKDTPDHAWDRSLVHEATHVWQYQNLGPRYSSEALSSQFYHQAQAESAYYWWDPQVNAGALVWCDWNPESQAQFIEDLWEGGEVVEAGVIDSSRGAYFGADGLSRLGQFFFAPTPVPAQSDNVDENAAAIRRWMSTLPPGEAKVNYSATAEGATKILHQDCERAPAAGLVATL